MYRSIIPPGKNPGHLPFLKNFGQIPLYVASLDGQMPHPLELQRGSNPPPSSCAKRFSMRKTVYSNVHIWYINNWLLFGLRFVSTAILMITRRLAAYTQAVVQLRSTRNTAIELNVLHYFI